MINKEYIDDLEYKITGACIKVHTYLGPGLLENIYHKCLEKELELQGINYGSEFPISIHYKELTLNSRLKVDLLVENCIVIEIKAVETLLPVHEAQLLTYMRLLKAPKGLLINFNSTNIVKHGKRAFVNELYSKISSNP